MKAKEVEYVWIFVDEYGDLKTEFIYPEEEEGKMPYQCEKASWDQIQPAIPKRFKIKMLDDE